MRAAIYLHPAYVTRFGIGDIVRAYAAEGMAVSNEVGSKFFHVVTAPRPEIHSPAAKRRALNFWPIR